MSTTLHDQQRPTRRTNTTSFPSSVNSHTALIAKHTVIKTNSSLPPGTSDQPAPQLHDLIRRVVKALEGLTGAHWDMEIFGLEINEEDENDSEREMEDTSRDRSIITSKGSERDEESEVAKALLLNGNGEARVAKAKSKVDWEVPRKLLHSSIGFLTVYLYLSRGDAKIVVYTLWSALCVIAPADYIRLKYPSFARVYERHLGFLMRESERTTTNGVIWYIIGVNFALTFYPLDVATVSILILSWADTAASTIGRLWAGHWGLYTPRLPSRLSLLPFLPGQLKHCLTLPLAPRKSLAGFIAASFTGACIALGFWGRVAPVPLRVERGDVSWLWDEGIVGSGGFSGWLGLGVITIFASVVSGVAEALDLGSLDDNLTLPIISGGCLWAFLKVLGLVSRIWINT
ncbi:hypothetical protein FB446DRAFT_482400 [Lentinula raphanica]|nr:hypothetical protein FB446DRAFT_482400 [Lentinula raphanica]